MPHQGQTVPAFTVAGTGSGPGNFGLPWTTGRLTLLVTGLAVDQYLQSKGEEPSELERSAAWASEEAAAPQVWPQLPPQLRSWVANEGANLALVQSKAPAVSARRRSFTRPTCPRSSGQQVCLTSIDVSVPGPDGSTDMAASQKQAQAVATELTAAANGGTPPTVGNGARYCNTPEQLIVQPAVFRQEVYALQPGKAGLVPQDWGYEVVQVRSRTLVPFNSQVASVIGVVALGAGAMRLTRGPFRETRATPASAKS